MERRVTLPSTMRVLLSESDGTTWEMEIPNNGIRPELFAPIFPSFNLQWMSQENTSLMNRPMITRRYKFIGVSGDIAFYDRVVDAEEIR